MTIRDMVARHSSVEENNDFAPTPLWATRALYHYVAPDLAAAAPLLTAWDPAAGHGHMCRVMQEYGHVSVRGTDVNPSERHGVEELDFLTSDDTADVIVTNPPYTHAQRFMSEGLKRSNSAFALLLRVQSLEGQARYKDIYNVCPPSKIAFFSDRIPFKMGEVKRKAPKMFFHIWLYWEIPEVRHRKTVPQWVPSMWIPPWAQKTLEKEGDYDINTGAKDNDDNTKE